VKEAEVVAKVPTPGPAAHCVGRQAFQRITSGKPFGSVHSRYRGAINVQTSQGLVCLVPQETGRGPLNINIDSEALAKAGPLTSGSPVAMGVNSMVFENGFCVSLSNAEVYEPTGQFEGIALCPSLIERNVSSAREVTLLSGHFAGVGELLSAMDGDPGVATYLNPFSAVALPNVKRLLHAIMVRNSVGAGEATKGLVGLGIGLTPSADDMLSGIMVSLILGSRNGIGADNIGELASRIARVSQGRTSALSHEFLLQAASGRANERLTRLVEAIYTGTPSDVKTATLDVVTIGETSGTDLVVGVIFGARAAVAREGPTAA
jgi:hypothetical protein